jgi:hypothetical protein
MGVSTAELVRAKLIQDVTKLPAHVLDHNASLIEHVVSELSDSSGMRRFKDGIPFLLRHFGARPESWAKAAVQRLQAVDAKLTPEFLGQLEKQEKEILATLVGINQNTIAIRNHDRNILESKKERTKLISEMDELKPALSPRPRSVNGIYPDADSLPRSSQHLPKPSAGGTGQRRTYSSKVLKTTLAALGGFGLREVMAQSEEVCDRLTPVRAGQSFSVIPTFTDSESKSLTIEERK